MIRPRHAALGLVLVMLSLISLQNSPTSHSDAPVSSSSNVSIHLVGQVTGWNATNPSGPNPTITVNQGDTVSIILTSGDITHQFAVDWDHDGTNFIGACSSGDNCSSVFGPGPSTPFTFTANFAPGNYTYFCTFHVTMVGILTVKATSPLPVTITGVTPNPADTGTTVTLTYIVANPGTLTGISIDWGDGTITHPSLTASSDTHTYSTTAYFGSQTFTINVTTANSAGKAFATTTETVNDRPTSLTITKLSPNPAKAGQQVTLNFTAADPDGTVQATWVDWGDGSVPDLLFNVTSGSMCQRLNPSLQSNLCTLAVGDLLMSRLQDPAMIVNGSIIIFRPFVATPSYLIVHRIIKIIPATNSVYNQITFWTEGDANAVPDPWDQPNGGIPASQVIAVYLYTLPPPIIPSARYDTHTYASIGNSLSKTYTIRVNATDNNGLASLQTVSENIGIPPPIVAINNLSPVSLKTGQTLTISFSATDRNGTISSLTVGWGDGSSLDVLSTSATSDAHSYARAGSFTIILTAVDNYSLTSSQTVSETVVDRPPALTITPPSLASASIGQTVAVSFSATDPDGTVSSFTVDWGDGSTPDVLSASDTSDTHSYSRAGSFTIVITARDNSGSASHVSSLPLAITAPSSPTSPAPTILGLVPIEFYTLIGIIAAIIVTAMFLAPRRSRKP